MSSEYLIDKKKVPAAEISCREWDPFYRSSDSQSWNLELLKED
jgi:hypothetical protein